MIDGALVLPDVQFTKATSNPGSRSLASTRQVDRSIGSTEYDQYCAADAGSASNSGNVADRSTQPITYAHSVGPMRCGWRARPPCGEAIFVGTNQGCRGRAPRATWCKIQFLSRLHHQRSANHARQRTEALFGNSPPGRLGRLSPLRVISLHVRDGSTH